MSVEKRIKELKVLIDHHKSEISQRRSSIYKIKKEITFLTSQMDKDKQDSVMDLLKKGRGRPKTRWRGSANPETYAVKQWIQSDIVWRAVASSSKNFKTFVDKIHDEGIYKTPCGVFLRDEKLNHKELTYLVRRIA